MTELLRKATTGDWKAVKKLLVEGADRHLADNQGFTALHHAAYFGHTHVVRALLEAAEGNREALLFQPLANGGTSLHVASHMGMSRS